MASACDWCFEQRPSLYRFFLVFFVFFAFLAFTFLALFGFALVFLTDFVAFFAGVGAPITNCSMLSMIVFCFAKTHLRFDQPLVGGDS
jgi:maltodextrin utilization protein YvdJ